MGKARRRSALGPDAGVGIQVPVGRIAAGRGHWQTVLDAPRKPSLYRLFNSPPRSGADSGNTMIVRVDGTRTVEIGVDMSADILGSRIRVKAGTGGKSPTVEGWYVLVS